jgi:hypothetical protein
MKKKCLQLLLAILFFLGVLPKISAQTVSYTVTGGMCAGAVTLTLSGTTNGKNTYSGTVGNFAATLAWSGTQWELTIPFGALFTNTVVTTLNPPCHNIGTFVSSALCAGGTVTASSGSCDGGAVPIELVDFSARLLHNAIELNWQTASETNNLGFHVERSNDGINFNAIHFVKSKGDSKTFTHYSLIDDTAPLGFNYYRLRQMESDGKETFSKIIGIKTDNKNSISFAPNPANHQLTVNFVGESGVLTMYDLLGRLVLNKTLSNNNAVIDISNLQGGSYIVQITANNELFKGKLMKN